MIAVGLYVAAALAVALWLRWEIGAIDRTSAAVRAEVVRALVTGQPLRRPTREAPPSMAVRLKRLARAIGQRSIEWGDERELCGASLLHALDGVRRRDP